MGRATENAGATVVAAGLLGVIHEVTLGEVVGMIAYNL